MDWADGSAKTQLAASPEWGGTGRKGRTGAAAAACLRGAKGPPASRTPAGKVIPWEPLGELEDRQERG